MKADLEKINHMTIVTKDARRTAENWAAFFGITENEHRDELAGMLTAEFGADLVEYVEYPYNYGSFAIFDTISSLSIGLCVNSYNFPQKKPENPALEDFTEIGMLVPDLEKAIAGWCGIFGKTEPAVHTTQLMGKQVQTALLTNQERYNIRLIDNTLGLQNGLFYGRFQNTPENNYSTFTMYDDGERTAAILDTKEELGIYLLK